MRNTCGFGETEGFGDGKRGADLMEDLVKAAEQEEDEPETMADDIFVEIGGKMEDDETIIWCVLGKEYGGLGHIHSHTPISYAHH